MRLSPDLERVLAEADLQLRPAVEAMGLGVVPHLERLRPKVLAPDDGAPEAVLESLDLEHEGGPDPLSLAACVSAHAGYLRRHGAAAGVSAGALALARILVWGERAALLGRAPAIRWIGPPPRRPELAAGEVTLTATCRVRTGDAVRRADAVAILRPPDTAAG